MFCEGWWLRDVCGTLARMCGNGFQGGTKCGDGQVWIQMAGWLWRAVPPRVGWCDVLGCCAASSIAVPMGKGVCIALCLYFSTGQSHTYFFEAMPLTALAVLRLFNSQPDSEWPADTDTHRAIIAGCMMLHTAVMIAILKGGCGWAVSAGGGRLDRWR